MADNSALIAGHLANLGYTPVQTAGILGNLQSESNLDPNAVGDNGNAYGIAQWNGPRWDQLNAFASQNGGSPSDIGTQVKFLDYELKNKEPTAYAALQQAKTPEDAATAFLHFERPAGYSPDNPMGVPSAPDRLANARAAFGGVQAAPMQLGSAAPQSPAGAPAPIPGLLAPDPAQSTQTPPLQGLLAQQQPGQPQATQAPQGLLGRQPQDGGDQFTGPDGMLRSQGLLSPGKQAAHPFQLGFKKRTA